MPVTTLSRLPEIGSASPGSSLSAIPEETGARRPHLLLVGWQGPPFNGRVHVVSSLSSSPFSERFTMTPYDTRIRNRKGGSRPDLFLAKSLVTQVSHLPAAIGRACPDGAVFFTGPGIMFWRDLMLFRALRRAGIPILVRFFGGVITENMVSFPAPVRRQVLQEFRHASAFLVETHAMVRDLEQLLPDVPAYRVPNFIHLDDLPAPVTKPQSGPVKIVYFGNMTPSKGVETVLRAVDQVVDAAAAPRAVEFHFIGGELQSGYLEQFREQAARLRHREVVQIHGRMPREKAHALAASADLFAFPTRWPGEGQPAALIEAMAMGLVPVTSRWRGVAEIVQNEENGISIDSPDDSAGFARAVIDLILDAPRRSRLAAAARDHIRREYDVIPALAQFEQITRETLSVSRRNH